MPASTSFPAAREALDRGEYVTLNTLLDDLNGHRHPNTPRRPSQPEEVHPATAPAPDLAPATSVSAQSASIAASLHTGSRRAAAAELPVVESP